MLHPARCLVSSQKIEDAISGTETPAIEFKEFVPAPQDLHRHLVALANYGGGVVVFGIPAGYWGAAADHADESGKSSD